MMRTPVYSSHISSVGWENEILEIEFKNGSVYQYDNVSKNEYISFLNSSSLGHSLSLIEKYHSYHRI